MAKKYIPKKMVKISRYKSFIPTLPDDIQRDIYSKMRKLIEEEKKYCDDGNYKHMSQIFTSIALYRTLQEHGKSEEEAYKITSEEMWKSLTPESYKKMAKLPFFLPMMKKILPFGFRHGSVWRKAYPKSWGRLFEKYCDAYLTGRKEEICHRADKEYKRLLNQMPDLGGKENGMAENMATWFSIVAFYEASDYVIDGKAFQIIHGWHIASLRFLGKIVDANKNKWPYKLFEKIYSKYEKQVREHQAKGEWKDTWGIKINPDNRMEGYSFHLIGCPIAKHAKEHGYEELLPYLCKTDHSLAHVLHAKLIRTQIEILGGDYCDYWYVGDKSEAAKDYAGMEEI